MNSATVVASAGEAAVTVDSLMKLATTRAHTNAAVPVTTYRFVMTAISL
jgi:hypothetical protein